MFNTHPHTTIYCADLIHIRRATLDSQIRYILGTPCLDYDEALEELEYLFQSLLPLLERCDSASQLSAQVLLNGLHRYETLLESWGHAELTRERQQFLS